MNDEIGMLVHVDEAQRREALAFVRNGRPYDLGYVLRESVPVFPGRHFRQTLVTTAHHDNGGGVGGNQVNWITEQIAGTQQLGTHIDAMSHLQMCNRGYREWTVAELAGTAGVGDLGVEPVPQIVTRSWLVDAPGVDLIGVEHLGGIEPTPGDAVLIPTGWGADSDDPETYLSREPSPRMAVAARLVEHGVALTGCDTWSYGPVPAENPDRPFELPQKLNVEHGVFIVENLDTATPATDGVREFALILTHPKLRGATGAWTSPIALV